MANGSPEEIRKLEAELREVLQQSDFALGLDIVEELEGKTELKAQHLAIKGLCLIKLRRKQDAKGVLLQAFELDPACGQATQLLDENFPGWTRPKQAARPAAPGAPMRPQGAPMAPQQDVSGFGQPAQSGYGQGSQSGYAQAPPGQVAPGGYQQQSATGSQPSFGRVPPIVVQATQGPPVYATHQADMVVNWRYVLDDLKTVPAAPPLVKHEDRVLPV